MHIDPHQVFSFMQVRLLKVRVDHSDCLAADAQQQLDAVQARAARDERAASDNLSWGARQTEVARAEVERLRQELSTTCKAHNDLKVEMAEVLAVKGAAEVWWSALLQLICLCQLQCPVKTVLACV